jgi:hypothetical protein
MPVILVCKWELATHKGTTACIATSGLTLSSFFWRISRSSAMSYKKKSKQMFYSELLHWKLANTTTTNTERDGGNPIMELPDVRKFASSDPTLPWLVLDLNGSSLRFLKGPPITLFPNIPSRVHKNCCCCSLLSGWLSLESVIPPLLHWLHIWRRQRDANTCPGFNKEPNLWCKRTENT